MRTFLNWLNEVGDVGPGESPELNPTLSRLKRDSDQFGLDSIGRYSNKPEDKPPTPFHPFMKKRMKKRQSSL